MGRLLPAPIVGQSAASGAQIIDGSLKFDRSVPTFLSRTPGSASNRSTWTLSVWVKTNVNSNDQQLLSCAGPNHPGGADISYISLNGSTRFTVYHYPNGGPAAFNLTTNRLFRDPSAWYHIVVAFDSTIASPSSDRIKIYVNGVRETDFETETYPSQDYASAYFNSDRSHDIGQESARDRYPLDANLTNYYWIDGQQLDASNFGFTDPLTNTWRPKKYTGTYGTNGFYLPMDNQDDFEIDKSGNGNNWTKNNFSGTSNDPDVLPDSPSGISGSTTSTSGITTTSQIKPTNYCTWNPINKTLVNLSNGNLDVSMLTGTNGMTATQAVTSGKWYWEVIITSSSFAGHAAGVGIVFNRTTQMLASEAFSASNVSFFYGGDGKLYRNGDQGAKISWPVNSTAQFAFDADNQKIWFGVNGTWYNSGNPAIGTNPTDSGFASGTYEILYTDGASAETHTSETNFGQKPFKYAPPEGFKTLCLANLPRPSKVALQPDKYFKTVLYTGNGGTQSISGLGFQPDFVWCKSRDEGTTNYTGHNVVQDSVRGTGDTAMVTNEEYSEANTGYDNAITSFDRDGFTLGSRNQVNYSGDAFVAWCWKAGGAAVTNNDGSASSQVSANRDSGFSIVTYTGQSSNFTWGHGLGVAPSMVIIKRRNTNAGWSVYHKAMGATKRMQLNQDTAEETMSYFQNTAPTDTVFSVTTNGGVGADGDTYLAYCWSEVLGFSKISSYTGNGNADGPFIHLGFRPAWVMIKATTGTSLSWYISDNKRNAYNVVNGRVMANLTNGESTSVNICDFTANGFKIRTDDSGWNTSGTTYIYAAFAEAPTNNLYGGQANAR